MPAASCEGLPPPRRDPAVRYVATRLSLFVPMLAGVVVVVFALEHLIPGDPARVLLGVDATPQAVGLLRHSLGLDLPLPEQFLRYLDHLVRGDLGASMFQNAPVMSLIMARLPATLELAVMAILISVVVGIPLGCAAAVYQGSAVDLLCLVFAQLGASITVFWLGILLMYVFSVELHWLPAIGRGAPLATALGAALTGRPGVLFDSLAHLAMPAVALGLQGAAVISRLVRATMLDTLVSDYVRTARAKGARPFNVVMRHALRNALLPAVTMIGWQFGNLLGGAVLTEGIFGWPGLGQLAVGAFSQRDIPLVQGIVLTFAVVFALVTLATDLAYGIIYPRVAAR
jgi:ABC-type dipeptide/oligopeptide/nickel transport system permease component